MKVSRPTRAHIDTKAVLHNINKVEQCAPKAKIIAMVKANAYGCGISKVVPVLDGKVHAFGVACLEEAMAIRALGVRTDCVLIQGVFSPDEWYAAESHHLQCVLHQPHQLNWLLATRLATKIKVWVKVNTGMHRLGFPPEALPEIMAALIQCPWVDKEIGIMTHLACADEPSHPANQNQLSVFRALKLPTASFIKSMANSAAILALPDMHADVVRPGIMLYGVSPFANQTGQELGLQPVVRFMSAISAIHHYPAEARIGYSGTWQTKRPSIIGVVSVGYGDGYPRHIAENTPVWVNGQFVPIVGRVSMDMLTIDLSDNPGITIGDPVELWGQYIPVEKIAFSARTSPYELICQLTPRVREERYG